MSEERQQPSRARLSVGQPGRSGPSAGIPGGETASEDRLAELEARLGRLEGGPGYRERGRHLLDRVMPSEASQHFRNAGREHLLGVRSIVDFWIRRIDAAEERSGSGSSAAERIDIE